MATETIQQDAQTQTQDADEFASLLKQSFKPRTERAATELQNAVNTLVEQALADTSLIKSDVLDTIGDMIAQLDKKLSAQMNEIMHAPEFQQLEGAWRGLKYLVFQSETDAMLKIRVMNVSKNELYRHLRLYPNAAWDQSPLFKKIYEEEFGQLGGQPYGCLVGDYSFSHQATDVQLLRDLSKIAGAAHAPFFAAADSTLMGMDSWNELMNPRDLGKLFDTPDFAAWRSLRDSDDARYIGLCMPRVLSRLPYGAKTEPVEEFGFEEDTDGHKGEKYGWMNAAYAMAANVNRAFKEYGWCARIRGVQSGGEVEELPTHTFPTDDGGVDLKCPTEIAISDRREAELAKSGLIPLIHRKNTDRATSSVLSRFSSRRPIRTTRTRPHRAICRPVCPICSPAAVSRTTSKSWCATRSVRTTRASSCSGGSTTGSANMLTRIRRIPRKRPSAAGPSPPRKSPS